MTSEAIKSAVSFLEQEFKTKRCDCDGVAQCVRCNTLFLVRCVAQGRLVPRAELDRIIAELSQLIGESPVSPEAQLRNLTSGIETLIQERDTLKAENERLRQCNNVTDAIGFGKGL